MRSQDQPENSLDFSLSPSLSLSLSPSLPWEDTARKQSYASQIEGALPESKHTKHSNLGLTTSRTVRYKCLFFKTKHSVIFCCGSWSWLRYWVSCVRHQVNMETCRAGRVTDREGIYFSRGDIWNLIFENFCWLHQPVQCLLNIIKLILKWLSSSHQAKMLIQTKKKKTNLDILSRLKDILLRLACFNPIK